MIPAVYNIEVFALGYWETVDIATDYLDACYLASVQCNNYPEERVRILDGDNKIL